MGYNSNQGIKMNPMMDMGKYKSSVMGNQPFSQTQNVSMGRKAKVSNQVNYQHRAKKQNLRMASGIGMFGNGSGYTKSPFMTKTL